MSEESTNTISMRIAKPSEEDLDGQIAFAHLLEHLFDRGIEDASLGWISKEERDDIPDPPKWMSAKLPDNHGFILFSFPYGDQPDARLNYVASCERKDAINTVKEWLLNGSSAEDWMKHLK